jgi:hypothetical protein
MEGKSRRGSATTPGVVRRAGQAMSARWVGRSHRAGGRATAPGRSRPPCQGTPPL